MRYGVILLFILLLAGCVPPTQEQLRMEKDLAEMKRRLARLEMQEASAETSAVVGGDTLQRQVAELTAGLDTLRVEFQSINGRLDDLGQSNQQLADDLQLTKDDLGLQLADLAGRVDQFEQKPIVTAPVTAPEQVEQKPEVKPETAEELYQRALDLVRKEMKFAEGRELLSAFTSKYPQHDLYVNALYWIGEALYGEKKYEMAILQLQDVISKHGNHPKAAAAMLKQGLAFNALGDAQNARTTMQKVIEEYPDTPQAEAAKKFLAQ